jgi:predicted permease
MRGPLELLRFVVARLDRRSLDRDMDDEMAAHIAMHAEALERQGFAPAEAARRARAEFGGVQQYREQGREARALSWIHDLAADLRYGARALRRAPGFALVCVLSLGLGIGANTAIFGLLYGVLLQPLHIPHAEELAVVGLTFKGETYAPMRRDDYLALRGVPGLPRIEAVNEANDVAVESSAVHDFAPIAYVEGGFLDLLAVHPIIGRIITIEDARSGNQVAVISDAVWDRYFARDRGVLGRQLSLAGHPFTVIGVMPPTFRGISFNGRFGVAVPQSSARLVESPSVRDYVYIIARIESAAARAALDAPLDLALHRCCLNARATDAADRHASFLDASRGVPFTKDDFRDDYRLVLWLLMGGVVLVLLIACSNVGNLLLARAAARERELAVRLSIGASRGRIVRQLLAESALLAMAGGVAGVALAGAGNKLLIAALPSGVADVAALIELHASPAILMFTAAISGVCVFAFGLGPALRATRGDLVSSLKDRVARPTGRSARVDRGLVVGQVAVTIVLVCGAGLLIATLRNLRAVDAGYTHDHLLAVNIETRGTGFERDGIVPIHREILDRIRRVPGVRSAGMATRIPALGGRNVSFSYAVVGQAPPPAGSEIDVTAITPGYFATIGTPLVLGRDVDQSDTRANAPVAVANEAFVRRHFATESPIGAQVRVDGLNGGEVLTVVGVVRDMRLGDRRTPPDPALFLPADQAGKWPFMIALVRTSVEPRTLTSPLRAAIESFSPSLRQVRWQTMDEALDEVLLRERLAAALASLCAALAMGLAMVGLAGLVGYSVARRTREIGIRMALGARGSGVVWLVLRGALMLVAAGAAIGGPLALVASRALESLLFGIAATNPVVPFGAVVALVGVGAIAAAFPAWRASRVDPVTALRSD